MNRSVVAGILIVTSATGVALGNHVTPELLLGRTGYLPGRALQAGVRLAVDPGWHCCWVNPGANGAKLRAVWELPPGWRAGGLGYPAPERFVAGGLPAFGYSGEVILPVQIEVPENASGEARLKLRLSWSACNQSGCVPGSVEIPVVLPQGGESSRDAIVISRAVAKVPRGLMGARMTVKPAGNKLQLALRMPRGREVDLSGSEVFPVTTEVIDPAAKVSFVRRGEEWVAVVPRAAQSRASGKRIELVFAGGSLPFPISVEGRLSG
jgi:DsbC/DsbD-like thiol-disulfide interchange protein